jgi:hypothetical protein
MKITMGMLKEMVNEEIKMYKVNKNIKRRNIKQSTKLKRIKKLPENKKNGFTFIELRNIIREEVNKAL